MPKYSTRDEFTEALRKRIGDDDSEEATQFIANMCDTYDELSADAANTSTWKSKYEQNDKEWRRKYRERFLAGSPSIEDSQPDTNQAEENTSKPKTFEDLFK